MLSGRRLALILLIAVGITAGATAPARFPRLIVDDSVADDFRALAEETWVMFLSTFRARSDCFGDVRLRATPALHSRAAYDPSSATVTVRVPGTRAMLQSALVHEWAHHVEFQCQAHETLRPAFLAAQGLPPDTSWRPAELPANTASGAWAGLPSEQYAETVVELVLGGRPVPTSARVSPAAVRVVSEWARGD